MKNIIFVVIIMNLFFSIKGWSANQCVIINNSWVITNSKAQIVGNNNGYSTQEICLQSLNTLSGDLVCVWNGKTFQSYNIETAVALGINVIENHFYDLEKCNEMIKNQNSKSAFMCSWNGRYYSPYNRLNNIPVTKEFNGWPTIESCLSETVDNSYNNLTCGWNEGPALYNEKGKIVSSDFKSMADCKSLLNLIRNTNSKTQSVSNFQVQSWLESFKKGTPNEKIGFPQKSCEVKEHNYHLTKSKDGYIVSECTPEILYTWGGFDKLEWFYNNLGNKKDWPINFPRALFTVPSAAATFGYGPIPIRIKVKPNTKFKLLVSPNISDCAGLINASKLKPEEVLNTIFARLEIRSDRTSFLEFILCSAKPIESWSFGQKENYDEILRDHKWMTTHHYYDWEAYSKKSGVDVYLNNELDKYVLKTDFSESTFNSRMSLLRALVADGMSRISVQSEEQGNSEGRHFKNSKPNYFLNSD